MLNCWSLVAFRFFFCLYDCNIVGGCCGHDRNVVGFTTTYAISAYHHWCCEFESRSGRGVQHFVIKFFSDLLQVGGFLRVLRFPPTIKLTAMIYPVTEILLKVALNTIKQTNNIILLLCIQLKGHWSNFFFVMSDFFQQNRWRFLKCLLSK